MFNLLPKDTVRQNWRSVGALQRFVEQRSARTGRQRPAPQAERRNGGAQCECRCRQAKRAGGAEVQGSRSRHRCEEEEPDAAPRCSDSQDRQGRKGNHLPELGPRTQSQHDQRHCRREEKQVEPRVERERCPELHAAVGCLVVDHSDVIVGCVLQRRSRAEGDRRSAENGRGHERLSAPALDHQICTRNSKAHEHRAMQIRPERQQWQH